MCEIRFNCLHFLKQMIERGEGTVRSIKEVKEMQ